MNVNFTSCIIGEWLTIDSLAVFILYLCSSVPLRHVMGTMKLYVHVLMRDAEGGKKEASKVKQITRQSNTQGSYFS